MKDYKSDPEQEQPDQNTNYEYIEYIVGEKLIRYLPTEKQEPQVIFGWSFNLLTINKAISLGLFEIVVVDRSDLKVYSVSLDVFCAFSRMVPVKQGYELFLAIEHWTINENPQPALIIDATFTDGDLDQTDDHKGDSFYE